MSAEPADLGYAAETAARFGMVYEADAGGWGSGRYIVVDRELGFKTAWSMRVSQRDSDRWTQGRLYRFCELVAEQNERWAAGPEDWRQLVVEG